MGQARDEAGNIWETDAAGNAVRLVSHAGQSAPQGQTFGTPDPMRQRQAAMEEERLRLAQTAAAQSAQASAIAAAKAQRDAMEWQATHNPDGSPKLNITQRPTLTAKERADAIAGYTSATQLDSIISQLEQQYKAGPGATSGLSGLQDYLPTTANKQFDSTGNAARGTVGSALGFTGGQLNTATEAQMSVGPYLPQSSDRDSVILDKIQRLKELRDLAKQRSIAILGGVPDANGNVTAVQQGRDTPVGLAAPRQEGPTPPQPMNPFAQDSGTAVQMAQGRTRKETDTATASALDAMFRAGASAQELDAFAKSRNPAYSVSPAQVEDMRAYLKKNPSYSGSLFNAPRVNVDNPLSARIAGSSPAAALIGAGNGISMGLYDYLDPTRSDVVRQAHPLAETAGEIAGAIATTKGIGGAGRLAAARFAPALLRGGEAANIARGVATDAAYGAGYGQNTQGDPLTGAITGGIASGLGQGVGGIIGKAAGGVAQSPLAQYLASRNIPMTVGQNLGGAFKTAEDKAMSLPFVGDMIARRRKDAFDAYNRAVLGEAGAPIGASTGMIGEAGANDLNQQIGNAYDGATAGVSVPLDPQFHADMANAGAFAQRMPEDYAKAFNDVGQLRIEPAISGGVLTGEGYQQAMRGLKAARASASGVGKSGFEDVYRQGLGAASDALRGQMVRGGGAGVAQGLDAADQAYRNLKVVQSAMAAAKNGTGTGEVQMFTPAQINTAAYQAVRKYPGPRPFAKLTDVAQQILPSKIPDSGTAGRLLQAALPATLAGGASYAAGGQEGAQGSALITALALLGGTKGGQKVLNKVLFDRPDALRKAGSLISKQKGLFGSAAVPLALEAQQ